MVEGPTWPIGKVKAGTLEDATPYSFAKRRAVHELLRDDKGTCLVYIPDCAVSFDRRTALGKRGYVAFAMSGELRGDSEFTLRVDESPHVPTIHLDSRESIGEVPSAIATAVDDSPPGSAYVLSMEAYTEQSVMKFIATVPQCSF
jgi:hypothetical protein